MNKLISIMVPIYNVEKCISRCLLSLFNQTYANIEYIFVNDCTPDKSMKILNDTISLFPNKKDQIKIIEHSKNLGLGAARRTAFLNATGDYLIHIDSDDWCEINMIEKMVNAITSKDEDIIICDYFVNYSNVEKVVRNLHVSSASELFKKTIRDEVFPSLCNKLIKKECYNNIKFPEFNLGEDYFIILQLIKNSYEIQEVNIPLFHYNQQNEQSITTKNNINLIDDIRVYTHAVKSLLVDWGKFKDVENDYYIGVLSRTLVITNGYQSKKALLNIEPKAYNLFNLWSLENKGFLKKTAYSLSFFGLGSVVNKMKKVSIKLRNIRSK